MSGAELTEMERSLRTQRENLRAERIILIACLSKEFPAILAHHTPDESGADYDWGWVVYIELPSGQVSFHIGESRGWFDHLAVANIPVWDGHNSEQKWGRVTAYLNGDFDNDEV
jgi:hypothetical protein